MDKHIHIVWSNENLDIDDWRDGLQELYPNASESGLYEMMCEINNEYLNDERSNLDVNVGNTIIVIGDIGRWNGRFTGYKTIESGNIKDCLYDNCDYLTWYVDENMDFRCKAVHHDGTNYYRYRVLKNSISDEIYTDLLEHIYEQKVTEEEINRCTDPLGPQIANIYGWDTTVSDKMIMF